MKEIAKYLFIPIIFLFIISACNEKERELLITPGAGGELSKNSCEGCHTDYDLLKSNYKKDPPSTGGAGCGGEAPHYEPYDRVVLRGDGYEEFKNSVHGKLGCITCHNGIENADSKDLAHSGDFIKKPSLAAGEKCATCHPDVVARTTNSTHEQGWGQKSMVSLRYGNGTGPEAFDALPQELKDGYKGNCQTCHGTCGECHITRPTAGGGGLANGHKFTKTPDMRKNCTTCHVSRGGHAYFGEGIGTVPDVHLTGNGSTFAGGFTCLECHSKNEMHGDGEYYDQRYKNKLKPECENCHSGLETSNIFHSKHYDSFNCQTCHSQDYNNCGNCHIPGPTNESYQKITGEQGGIGARVPAHLKFKIGMNPLPHKPYRMATLRQSLMGRDSWDQYGVTDMAYFDIRPTYKYTTPHNIIKWTERTKVDSLIDTNHDMCAQACHIVKDAEGNFLNKQYYLFESDLEDWEKPADQGIIVDGKLPANWQVN